MRCCRAAAATGLVAVSPTIGRVGMMEISDSEER
jgi:hypothetical protein